MPGWPSPLAEQIARRRTAAFGHIARLADSIPARLALRCQIDASLGRLPSKHWKRRPGHSREQMARSSSARLLTVPLLICGKELFFVVMVLERRYGSRWLRGPDDDELRSTKGFFYREALLPEIPPKLQNSPQKL